MDYKNKQSFRIVINSVDRISGALNDGFFKINGSPSIQLKTDVQYQFAVEQFTTSTLLTTLLINIPSLIQKDSYNTTTQSTNSTVLIASATSFSRNIQHNTIGILITSIDFIKSSILEVQFTDVTNTLVTMSNWSLSLVIWEVEN